MRHIFNKLSDIVKRIKANRSVLLLFDYDGTLTPIVEEPELAELSDESRKSLKALAGKKQFTIGIISGRAISDIKSKVNIDNIIYAGNHGLEIEGPGLVFIHPITDEIKSTLRLIGMLLRKTMAAITGTMVEDKGLTLSVHYRRVQDKQKEREVKNTFENVTGTARMLGKVDTTSGKKVYEVRPSVQWHKGKAIELIIRDYQKGKTEPLVIYLGDDLTDEDAFKSVKALKGISIYVGGDNPDSGADYYLESTGEVYKFIDKLLILE